MSKNKSGREDIKGYIRDLNLSLVMVDHKIETDISKRKDKYQFLKKNYKLIKYITKNGGVLTGSRAIRCYSINNKQILDRHSNDWDFVITRDMAFKICDYFGMKYDLSNFISVKGQRWTVHPSYSDSYRIGVVDVQMIIKEELPDYNEVAGIRISTLSYALGQKTQILFDCDDSREYEKHQNDLLQIITKFNSI
jgi:hypothetical protein